MNKVSYFFLFVFTLIACENVDYDNDLKLETESDLIFNEDLKDAIFQNLDTTVYYVNDLEDLMATMDTTWSASWGFKEGEDVIDMRDSNTRASVQKYSITGSTVDFDDMEGQHYIKLKLSQKVADRINYQYVNPSHVIKAATYICCWQYQDKTVRLNTNQRFGALESLSCGLIPATKDQLFDCLRGYASFPNYQSETEQQMTMRTCCLRIVALDTNNITEYIDMRYPCPWTSTTSGYVYVYQILTI